MIKEEADPNCKKCYGTGRVNVCSGFGGDLGPYADCMCIIYKKLGIDPNKKRKEDEKRFLWY